MAKASERLIIFTRYPEPGQTKTRLIPALGAQGAAQLQQQMSEHILTQARRVQQQRSLDLEVQFTGGDRPLMRTWLGEDLRYQPQREGDLGQRMATAFGQAFMAGLERVVIIGIDCPGIDVGVLSQAFEQLQHKELVLGPATDGGYYLIGLSSPRAALFSGIDWGTSQVFQQTQAIAEQLNIPLGQLPFLSDVDRPEDLGIWESYCSS